MNGCNMSFNSVDALQRHMMRHFERTPPAPAVKAVVQSDALDALPPVPSPRSEEGAISDSGSSASSTHKGETKYDTLYPPSPLLKRIKCNWPHFRGSINFNTVFPVQVYIDPGRDIL